MVGAKEVTGGGRAWVGTPAEADEGVEGEEDGQGPEEEAEVRRVNREGDGHGHAGEEDEQADEEVPEHAKGLVYCGGKSFCHELHEEDELHEFEGI